MTLAGVRTLVTGGAGFVGSHLVDALVTAGASVAVVDNFVRGDSTNLKSGSAGGNVTLENADIQDPEVWDRLLPGVGVVFHQAALRVTRCEESPEECWRVMVDATRRLFAACARHRVPKVVFASSAIVYGAADELPTRESHHLNHSATWYGAAKIAGEQMLGVHTARGELSGVVLRYFNVYGPRMATQGHTEVFVKWLQAMDRGEPVRIFGDGTQTMDWIDVRDVARANVLAAALPATGVFNIGSGRETALGDVARLLLRARGIPGDPVLVKDKPPVNPIPRRWADNNRALGVLGWAPRFTLEQGLQDIARWWTTECSPRPVSSSNS